MVTRIVDNIEFILRNGYEKKYHLMKVLAIMAKLGIIDWEDFLSVIDTLVVDLE